MTSGRLHAEVKKFRERRDLVEGGAVDAELVNIGGDRVRLEAAGEHLAGDLEGERALAVADVEDDAAFAGGFDRWLDRTLAGDGAVGEGAEAVGQHVARAHFVNNGVVGWRGVVKVDHERHADFLGNEEGCVERRDALGARGSHANADLDANDEIAILVRDAGCISWRHHADVLALADHDGGGEGVDARKRDVEIGEDTGVRRFDNVLAEPGEIAGTGRAGVDRGGDATGAAELVGIDAKRGAAPVDVGVEVDQAGCDDEARRIADLGGGAGGELARIADAFDSAVLECNVGDAVDALRRIDDAAAADDEIGHGVSPLLTVRDVFGGDVIAPVSSRPTGRRAGTQGWHTQAQAFTALGPGSALRAVRDDTLEEVIGRTHSAASFLGGSRKAVRSLSHSSAPNLRKPSMGEMSPCGVGIWPVASSFRIVSVAPSTLR